MNLPVSAESGEARLPRRLYLILGILAGLGPFSIDMYLPALPEIGAALDASDGAMQMTVTAFLVGLVFGPVVLGPVSDAVGRRPPILWSMVLYCVVSLIIAAVESVEMMIVLRVVQAASGGTSMSLVRSMIRDLLSGNDMARAMSVLMVVVLGAPIMAPFFGGLLLLVWGWRSIFVALAVIGGLMLLAATRWLPETLAPEMRRPLDLASSWAGYRRIARSRTAVAYAVTGGAAAGVLFSYLAATPFVYIDYFGFDEQWFGALFGISIIGAWLAQLFNIRYVNSFGYAKVVTIGSVALVAISLILWWVTRTDLGGLPGVVAASVAAATVTHLIHPGALSGVLDGFPDLAGSASGFASLVRFTMGASGTALVGLLNDGTPKSYGVSAVIFAVIGVFSHLVARRCEASALP